MNICRKLIAPVDVSSGSGHDVISQIVVAILILIKREEYLRFIIFNKSFYKFGNCSFYAEIHLLLC
jgi:hypothetical protein